MAQHWAPFANSIGGIPGSEGDGGYGTMEFEGTEPETQLTGVSNYPPLNHEGHQYGGNLPAQTSFYSHIHPLGTSNGTGGDAHHEGTPGSQHPYNGQSLNPPAEYSASFSDNHSQLRRQYVGEQPGYGHGHGHAHTPNAFSSQAWNVSQSPPVQNQFTLSPMSSGHNPRLTYQQPQNPGTYQGYQNQPMLQNSPNQGQRFLPQGRGVPTFPTQQPVNGFAARNGQVPFVQGVPQSTVQHFQSLQNGDGHLVPYQNMPGPSLQELRGATTPFYMVYPQAPGATTTAQAPITPGDSRSTQNVGPPPVNDQPTDQPTDQTMDQPNSPPTDEIKEGVDGWTRIEGVANLLIKNPPPTRIGKFSEVKSTTTPSGEKPYVPKYDTRSMRLFPNRSTRLACEIRKEYNELTSLKDSLPKGSPQYLSVQAQITELENEPVIIATDQETRNSSSDAKVESIGKPKPLTMESTPKPGKPESGNEENILDTTARKIKSARRPDNALKAVEYDVINILWHDPKPSEGPQKTVSEIIDRFGEYITDLWNKSKELTQNLDKARNENDQAKVKSVKASLDDVHDLIRAAVEAAITYGEKHAIRQLASHQKLPGSLCILLRNRFAAGDYNGRLPKAILKLISMITNMDMAFLTEKVKLDRTRRKYEDKLDDDAIEYMDVIFENAKKHSAKLAKEARETGKKSSNTKKAAQGDSKKASSTDAKDPAALPSTAPPSKATTQKDPSAKKAAADVKKQTIDYSGLGSARKISNTPGKTNSTQASKRPREVDIDTRAPKKAAVENASGAPTATRTPSAVATPARARPSGSMLPGRPRAAAKPQPKKPAPRASSPSHTGIGSLLAEIESDKVPEKSKEPEKRPETSDEAARRLRRESRRHLRVSWKPDDQLTDIRILEHDTAEDGGRIQSMLRDARDNRSEGQMLKQRVRGNDDEDEEKPREVPLRDWCEPSLYHSAEDKCSVFYREDRQNFETKFGPLPMESEQKKVMEEYESRELMAIYTSLSEIPDTPKSPTGKIPEGVYQPKIQVLRSDPSRWHDQLRMAKPRNRDEFYQRWIDGLKFGRNFALDKARRRLEGLLVPHSVPQPPREATHYRSAEERDQETLTLLSTISWKNWVDPDPYDPANPKTHRRHDYADPKVQKDIDALEDTFAKFAGKPFPPTEPPEHIQNNPERVAEWLKGHNRDQETKTNQQQGYQAQVQPQPQTLTSEAIQMMIQQAQALRAQPHQPTTQSVAQPTAQLPQANIPPPTQPALLHPALQQVLASLNVSNASASPAPAAASATTPAGWPIWPPSQTQAQIQPQTNQTYSGYGYNTQPFGGQAQSVQPQSTQNMQSAQSMQNTQTIQTQRDGSDRGNRKDFHRANKEQKGINRSLIGTKPCSFWAKGQCAKGDKCTFRHDPSDLKK